MQLLVRTGLRVWALGFLALMAACATIEPSEAHHLRRHHHAPPKPSPQDIKFAAFVKDFRVTALAAGITPATYDAAMSGITHNPHIEGLTQSQPEFVKPIWTYLDTATSSRRVSDGQRHLSDNLAALTGIEAKFGVPKEILVSIWGNETDFGGALGEFNLFEALATLAYEGERMDFGKTELLAALKLVQQDGLDPKQMPASWAGAIGQLQMLPSTYLKSAVDGDADGKRDLFHDAADALASAAAEVTGDGWQRGHVWGYEVKLPANFAYEFADGDTTKAVADWSKLGVTAADGTALPPNGDPAAILVPAGVHGPAFLAFPNFKVILKYNNAVSYALAVCTLADMIAGRAGVIAAWPRDEQPLSRDERIALQTALQKLGFDPGKIDGVLGHGVRAAVRLYQKARNIPADGFPTMGVLSKVLLDVKQKGL